LIAIDPITKRLKLHGEAKELANMTPNKETKTIISESWEGYDLKNRIHLTLTKSKWINGILQRVGQKDTVIP